MGANGNEIVVEFDCGSQQFADCAAAIIKVRVWVRGEDCCISETVCCISKMFACRSRFLRHAGCVSAKRRFVCWCSGVHGCSLLWLLFVVVVIAAVAMAIAAAFGGDGGRDVFSRGDR